MRRFLLSSIVVIATALGGATHAQSSSFSRFVEQFWTSANKAGISRRTYDNAFKGVTPDPEVLKKAEYQPEFTKPIWEYLATAVSQKRIENGRKMLRQYRSLVADL
jgi:membrane-bound lytic murein transglycosylase B